MTKKHTSPIIDMPPKELAERAYSDEELEPTSEMQEKLEKLMKFFDESGIDYDKFNPDSIPKVNFDRKGYPNYDQYMYVPGQRDTSKWLDTVRTLYFKEKNGTSRTDAIRQATSGWNHMETFDFLNWLKFHEEGAHMKYKYAQLWYENDAPGYFLHIKQDPKETPAAAITGHDIDNARDQSDGEMSNAEKKSIIEKQRHKIIGRLDSAEKLLRSQDGQMFAGKELESLMESIYTLKKKVQLVNKLSTSIKLYEDMIVRQSNILQRNGFSKAAEVLYALAQTSSQSGQSAEGIKGKGGVAPPAAVPAPPGQSSGAPGGLPSMGPGQPQNPPDSAPNDNSPTTQDVKPKDNKSKGITEFLQGMETAKVTVPEDEQNDDDLEADDDLEVMDEPLVVEAQEAPLTDLPAKPLTPVVQTKENEQLEVNEDDIPKSNDNTFNIKMDAMFANSTISDIINELEDLAKVFKVREIPRRLSLVDMMLDGKGLASYFPTLSEAQNKALEANNYCSTRVEDILSKLRGAIATKEIDLQGEDIPENPEMAGIKNKLKSDEDKEKARKQMRKNIESEELDEKGKETPNVEIEEDLSAPIVPAVKTAPINPVKAPAVNSTIGKPLTSHPA